MTQQTFIYHEKADQLLRNIQKVIIGKEEVTKLSIVALLAQGHVLLEDVPGVGKTMLVRALAKSLNCEFKRIQFTPDLLPSDVTGVSIYNPKELQFEFRPGPILGNIVLADEINRTSPKTQSALLEGMEEKNITVDGMAVPLKKPFFVMATQNPIEYEGTYPLPEAQLDRFLLKLNMGYPTYQEEIEMLNRTSHSHPIDSIEPIMDQEQLVGLQQEVDQVLVNTSIQRYIVEIVSGTRNHPHVYLGASPRGSIALMKAAKAYAFLHNRDYVVPDDVKYLAPFVLSHRIITTSESRFEDKDEKAIVEEVLAQTKVPIDRG
ncbi:AAA family ATPase [Salinibacillus xinjiangensis]|uniref:AAA domain-containing protein n=1 Tax=Salinibacillus xinjiangensis TaxID=1229268 RepID=A0A6G1X9B6_9BACI|nr:MoxR family ATPase [Salinibacillus xinjiangensis]MRG87388.1 AAA domain-containing protein [Salinibacillus xinjiangensis]